MTRQYGLDNIICYRIEYAGFIGENWPDWIDQNIASCVSVNSYKTIITGTFDQAGLLGLLRRLYYLGFPLISVNLIDSEDDKNNV